MTKSRKETISSLAEAKSCFAYFSNLFDDATSTLGRHFHNGHAFQPDLAVIGQKLKDGSKVLDSYEGADQTKILVKCLGNVRQAKLLADRFYATHEHTAQSLRQTFETLAEQLAGPYQELKQLSESYNKQYSVFRAIVASHQAVSNLEIKMIEIITAQVPVPPKRRSLRGFELRARPGNQASKHSNGN